MKLSSTSNFLARGSIVLGLGSIVTIVYISFLSQSFETFRSASWRPKTFKLQIWTNIDGTLLKWITVNKLIVYIPYTPFTRVRTNFCMDKNLQGSTFHIHETCGTAGRIFERLSVKVWDLKKVGPKLEHLAGQKFVQFHQSRVNAR